MPQVNTGASKAAGFLETEVLSMGSKLKTQYHLTGGKIHQKSLDHHPEEGNHYFSLLLVSFPYSSVGFPAPHQTVWIQVIYGAKAGQTQLSIVHLLIQFPEPLVDHLGIWQIPNIVLCCLGCSFFVLCSREGRHLSRKI